MEGQCSQALGVGVSSIPAANLLIGQVQILVLSSHSEWKKKIVTELVRGTGLKLVRNALWNICQSNVISCQERRAGIAVPQSSKKMNFVKQFIQWEWKLWSV